MNSTRIPVGNVYVEMLDDDDAIVRMTRNNKAWEPETRNVWHGLVQPDTLVMDIGAYTGIYSIASALMGAHVTAFEPHPANYKRLRANAALNSVRIQMLQWAASDQDGQRPLMMKHSPQLISDIASLEEGSSGVMVQTKRIDGMTVTKRLTLIKIDAEMHEPSIISGAIHTIAQHRPLVLVECLNDVATFAVQNLLLQLGYKRDAVLDGRNHLFRPGG